MSLVRARVSTLKRRGRGRECGELTRAAGRYYPPGIILEYTDSVGDELTKPIDLLHLTPDTDVDVRRSPLPAACGAPSRR